MKKKPEEIKKQLKKTSFKYVQWKNRNELDKIIPRALKRRTKEVTNEKTRRCCCSRKTYIKSKISPVFNEF